MNNFLFSSPPSWKPGSQRVIPAPESPTRQMPAARPPQGSRGNNIPYKRTGLHAVPCSLRSTQSLFLTVMYKLAWGSDYRGRHWRPTPGGISEKWTPHRVPLHRTRNSLGNSCPRAPWLSSPAWHCGHQPCPMPGHSERAGRHLLSDLTEAGAGPRQQAPKLSTQEGECPPKPSLRGKAELGCVTRPQLHIITTSWWPRKQKHQLSNYSRGGFS